MPERLIADTANGSGSMLDWLVEKRGIAPHIPVIDKSGSKDGTFERADFTYDAANDLYICPDGKKLKHNRRAFKMPRTGANKFACQPAHSNLRVFNRIGPKRTFDQSILAVAQLPESRRGSISRHFKGSDGSHADFAVATTKLDHCSATNQMSQTFS